MKRLIVLVFLLLPLSAFSATYYVDGTNGNDTNDGSIGAPWKDPQAKFASLSPGDTLIFRAGTYQNANELEPSVNGTEANPITLKAYDGENVYLISATAGADAVVDVTEPSNFIGAALRLTTDWYIIDGFKVYGSLFLAGDHYIVKNCELWKGGDGQFGCCLRPEGGANGLIQNCYLHDNVASGGSAQGVIDNYALLIEYRSTNLVIEYCTFSNGYGTGIYFKDNPHNVTVRYSVFDNLPSNAISTANQSDGTSNNIVNVHNNIIRNCGTGFYHMWRVYSISIYNNTFYGNTTHISGGWGGETLNDFNIYNNIFASQTTFINSRGDTWLSYLGTLDYNGYYGSGNWIRSSVVATSLSGWVTWIASNYAAHDTHSINSDPSFVNAAGGDFRLSAGSPCLTASSAGTPIGAYIIGSETIGYTAEGGTLDPDTTPPTPTISTSDPITSTDGTATVEFSCTANCTDLAGYKWRIGSAPDATHGTECTSPATITGLSVGSNTVYIGAGDAAGNWGSDSITVNYSPVASSTTIINSGIRGGGGVR